MSVEVKFKWRVIAVRAVEAASGAAIIDQEVDVDGTHATVAEDGTLRVTDGQHVVAFFARGDWRRCVRREP